MRRRRLQSPQKALVMLVTKETVPTKPGTRKFFATSPEGSWQRARQPQDDGATGSESKVHEGDGTLIHDGPRVPICEES